MTSKSYVRFEEPDIAGASTAPGHQGEIDVLSWTQSVVPPAGSEQDPQHLSFTKYLDGVTKSLLESMRNGKQFRRVTITCFRTEGAAGNQPAKYLTIAMEHVVIDDYAISSGPGDVSVENISLRYGLIQYDYTPQKSA